jgi:hypothetical protein
MHMGGGDGQLVARMLQAQALGQIARVVVDT